MIQIRNTNTPKHTVVEDAIAMLMGTVMVGFAIIMIKQAGLLTGGTAGLALLLHYSTNISVGVLFFFINLPFYYLAFKRLGMQMFLKTFVAVTMLAIMLEVNALFIDFSQVNPVYTSIVANIFMGLGCLCLFRHRASLGGFNLLALYMQEYYKIPAGRFQLILDTSVILGSLVFVSPTLVFISVIGVIILNFILTLNHREDRYAGFSG